jgi:Organic solvent tolerance protein OstA
MIKLLLILLLLFPSCSFKKEEPQAVPAEVRPSLVLSEARYTLGQDGNPPLLINGSTITLYENESKAILKETNFLQKDEQGVPIISGTAETAQIDTKTKTAHFSGNVELKSEKNGYHIKTGELTFDTEAEKLKAKGSVEVTFPDGMLKCTGLEADLRANTFLTGSIEEGELKN